jgi:hypothetical protein
MCCLRATQMPQPLSLDAALQRVRQGYFGQ